MIVIPIRVKSESDGFEVDLELLNKKLAFWLKNIVAGTEPHGFYPDMFRFDIYPSHGDTNPYISLIPCTMVTSNQGGIIIFVNTSDRVVVSDIDFDSGTGNVPYFTTVTSTSTSPSDLGAEQMFSGIQIETYGNAWDPDRPETWGIKVINTKV